MRNVLKTVGKAFAYRMLSTKRPVRPQDMRPQLENPEQVTRYVQQNLEHAKKYKNSVSSTFLTQHTLEFVERDLMEASQITFCRETLDAISNGLNQTAALQSQLDNMQRIPTSYHSKVIGNKRHYSTSINSQISFYTALNIVDQQHLEKRFAKVNDLIKQNDLTTARRVTVDIMTSLQNKLTGTLSYDETRRGINKAQKLLNSIETKQKHNETHQDIIDTHRLGG